MENLNVDQLIQNLAEKLGVATEMLWKALMKQAIIEGITGLCMYVLFALSIYLNYRLYKYGKKTNWDEEHITILCIFFIALNVLFLVIFLCSISIVFSCFFNREYWALHNILSLLGK